MHLMKLGVGIMSCVLLASPALLAQDSPEPEESGNKWDQMSDEELKAEFARALKATSESMENLEGELSKASLPERKPDEQFAEIKGIINKLSEGKVEELPEGLKGYFEDNPDKLAELLEDSKDNMSELLKDDKKLIEKLANSSEKLVKMLEDSEVLEEVVRKQNEIEKNLNDVIDRQEELGESTRSEIESVLECAYRLRRQ